jgi:hypothetical protein
VEEARQYSALTLDHFTETKPQASDEIPSKEGIQRDRQTGFPPSREIRSVVQHYVALCVGTLARLAVRAEAVVALIFEIVIRLGPSPQFLRPNLNSCTGLFTADPASQGQAL